MSAANSLTGRMELSGLLPSDWAPLHDGMHVEHHHGVAVVEVVALDVARIGAVEAREGRAAERAVDVQRDQPAFLAVVRIGHER